MLDKWLRTISLLLGILLLCLLCLVAWQLLQIGTTVIAISSSVNQMAGSVAEVTKQVERLGGRIGIIEKAAEVFIDPKEIGEKVGVAMQEIAGKEVNAPPMEEGAEDEINHLLLCIGDQKNRYEYGGEARTAAWVYLKLSGKYALFKSAIASADDFIDRIATETREGEIYYVILDQGEKKPLGPWLRETLAQYRAQVIP